MSCHVYQQRIYIFDEIRLKIKAVGVIEFLMCINLYSDYTISDEYKIHDGMILRFLFRLCFPFVAL